MSSIKIGVSSCLLGNKVRHDGSAKRHSYVVDTLGRYFELRPQCPELGAGLGVPRPTLRLKKTGLGVRVLESKDYDRDHTEALRDWSEKTLSSLEGLSGFILKNASPSCGMERVKVYDANDVPKKEGTGVFAGVLMQSQPALPVEEEGRLNDPVLRENFIQRIYVHHRWQQLLEEGLTVSALHLFHQRHKMMLMAHDEAAYRQLGPMVAGVTKQDLEAVAGDYFQLVMQLLKKRASRKRHSNVLMHILGYLKRDLGADIKQDLLEVLDSYRLGTVPLVVPVTMIRHYFRQYPDDYMARQYYLDPYPKDLMLRNQL